jgi:hypothetical protein
MIPLPPKRFQSTDDPIYDPIRHRPWFAKLETRRAKLPFLREALRQMKESGLTQLQAAENAGVDERELRDYAAFMEGRPLGGGSIKDFLILDAILKDAAALYEASGGEHSLRHYLEKISPLWGRNPRPIVELYETDPTWYPEGYTKPL